MISEVGSRLHDVVTVLLLRLYPASYGLITAATVVAYTWFTIWSTEKRSVFRMQANLADDGVFDLQCGPKSAAERIQILLELGYDDLIVVPRDSESGFSSLAFSRENLEAIRALVPADDHDYRA